MRAAKACKLPAEPQEVLAELRETVGRNDLGLFVACAAQKPVAIVICLLPSTVFQLAPFVVVAYAEARTRRAQVAIGKRLREWLTASGYTAAVAANLLHSDGGFMRGFGHFGQAERIGSLVRFSFGEP